MAFVLYDRFFIRDEATGTLKTFWRTIGNKNCSIVQLDERVPIETLNCFKQNIASLYIFCKATQSTEFEKKQLNEFYKQYGNNIKIFKFKKEITIALTACTLVRNFDNLKNIFMMYSGVKSNIDSIMNKETISLRYVYVISFNNDKIRNEIMDKINLFNLTTYPAIETFIPFDDECELFLNIIFAKNRRHDTISYPYMGIISDHLMEYVQILETNYNLIQYIIARSLTPNTLFLDKRETIKNTKTLTNMFLDNVPVVDIFIGRVYENEQCIEFNSSENEIIFIMIKMYIFKCSYYTIFINGKYQTTPITKTNDKLNNIITCEDERGVLTSFLNLYTHGFIFRIFNKDVHFLISSKRFKSNTYTILYRIIYNNLWSDFSQHVIISEDGKNIRFNRNSIILFDKIDNTAEIITNNKYIEIDTIYNPELYSDSDSSINSSLENLILNVKPEKMPKYIEIKKYLDEGKEIKTMSLYDMVVKIFTEEEGKNTEDYNILIESMIELSNKVRIPLTLLYSLSTAQIAYRLIFYTNLRNGIFLIMDQEVKTPYFYQAEEQHDKIINSLKKLSMPQKLKIFENIYNNEENVGSDKQYMFQNLIKKFIPTLMTGNLIENYFNFFCPGKNYFPIISSIVENESELLSIKNTVIWSRQHLFCNSCIVSFDFSLYNSSILALFGMDFQNCGIFYGFELKNFFYSIFPDEDTFNNKKNKFLQLPYTFIMSNDTLKIINILEFQDLNLIEDHLTYIIIMRFITSGMMQRINENYHPLSGIFYDNILHMNKYKTRLTLHKDILNSICGMLSAYEINTVLLNIVNALSRKIILWIVTNCLPDNIEPVSFLEHEYSHDTLPPKNLISIENDSFTFVYSHNSLDYNDLDNEYKKVENMKCDILKKLHSEIEKCTMFTEPEISQIFKLKLNFLTGNLFQTSSRNFYYLSNDGNENGNLSIVSNEKNNRLIQKSLKQFNLDDKLVKLLRKNNPLKFSYLKKTHNFPEIRHLLIWYLMQHSRKHKNNLILNNDQPSIFNEIRLINEFVNRQNYENVDIDLKLNILLNLVRVARIESYFLSTLSKSILNLYFKKKTIPENNVFDSIQLPSDKKILIINCIQVFFKLYQKYFLKC